MSKEPLPYRVDPAHKIGAGETGVFVRAMDGELWGNADIAWLDADSLVRWLSAEPTRAVQVCGLLLGHDRVAIDAWIVARASTIPVPANELLVVREDVFEDGCWLTCRGCHESNEGHPTGPYSKALRCHVGGGCRECGGIGAIWEELPPKLKCCPRFTWGDGAHDLDCPGEELPK